MVSTSSSVELSVVTTTETAGYVTQTTAANVAMTSSSRGIELYFECAVIVIGVLGMAANALIIYAMVVSKQHKKQLLLFHQNAIDFVGCFFLVTTYIVKMCNVFFTGLGGYWLCILFQSENFIWWAILASKVNLMVITIERYLKVCFPIWSKKNLHEWILHSGAAFAWISSLVHMFTVTLVTSFVKDGVCYMHALWESPTDQVIYVVWASTSYYIAALVLFIFCYWRILLAIRRQARVMAAHSAGGPGTAQTHFSQIQISVVKTMILVCAFFVITDTPRVVYALLLSFYTFFLSAYYATIFLSFLYICANPFIYATKFDPVKRVLLNLIPCKKTPVQPLESIGMNAPGSSSNRAGQSHK